MKLLNNYIRPLIIFIITIIILPLILSILNLFKLTTSRIEIIIIGAVLMLLLGFILGKKVNSKGYLNGLLFSVICIFIMFITSLIFNFKLNINTLIYYLILIFSTIFGAMIGITKNIKNKL